MIADASCQSPQLMSKRALLQQKALGIGIVWRQALEQTGKLKKLIAP